MHAVAKAGQGGARAEELLSEMTQAGILPNVISYSIVMDAYARQSKHDPQAAVSAERVMFDLIRLSEQRPDIKVTSVTCDTVLNAWAQQGTWQGAERAEQILHRLEGWSAVSQQIRPTAHSYAAVIDGWAKCGGGAPAAMRAQKLLDTLLRRDKDRAVSSNPPQIAVLSDTVVFNACINAWATSRDPQAGTKAVRLLRQMKELHETKGYNCHPDTVTYNTVLSAWSHSGHIHAASQAEKILQDMRVAHRAAPDSAPAPDTYSYNNVLNAWANSPLESAAKRAEEILNFMIRSGQEAIAPDGYSFTAVLNVLAKSQEPDKAIRAQALLQTMLRVYVESSNPALRPTPIPFNIVLNAAAFSKQGTEEQQRQALQCAVQTFSLMKAEGVPPDEVSYGNLLKTFANLVPPGPTRSAMALNVFTRCVAEGKVGELAWNEARRAVPATELSKVVREHSRGRASGKAQWRDLPREWRQRVQKAKAKKAPSPTPDQKQPKEDGDTPVNRTPVKRFRTLSESTYQSSRDL
jgi:Pentatricopeptide repeat domain